MTVHIHGSAISCGVLQLSGFDENDYSPVHVLTRIKRSLYLTGERDCSCEQCQRETKNYQARFPKPTKRCAFLIFSHHKDHSVVAPLVKFIEDKKLGTLTISKPLKNPNSGNTIIVYLWAIPEYAEYEAALK